MNWETYLITLYVGLCKDYERYAGFGCQRFTNGGYRRFSDEEVMVIYLFGLIRGFYHTKAIYQYTADHLRDWFPHLPGYAAFVHRLNRLSEAFRLFIDALQTPTTIDDEDEDVYLVDSFPIALAYHQHAYRARVAPELASRSYDATKTQYDYGIKAHVVGCRRPGHLPTLKVLVLDEASHHDGPVFDQIRPSLHDTIVIGDKAYQRPDAQAIEIAQDLRVITPVRKQAGKPLTTDERTFSQAVSRLRQPIEALFAWLQRVTMIEKASLVRSSKGLLTHLFGRFAAAMLLTVYPYNGGQY